MSELGPAFHQRPAWVVFYQGAYFCRAPLHVVGRQTFVLADSALEAVDYIERERFSRCEPPIPRPIGPDVRRTDAVRSVARGPSDDDDGDSQS